MRNFINKEGGTMKTYTLILILSLISAACHAHTMHDGTHTHTLLDFDKGVLEKQGGTADHYHDDISVKHTHNGIETRNLRSGNP